jgi:hypothetical protein
MIMVHDHTRMHHLPHLVLRPGKSKVPNNSKLRLKQTKRLLGIPLASLSALSAGVQLTWESEISVV